MKMFANNVAACVKVAGKVLKEKNETFFLPFGSEYSVYLKNLNAVRIAVRISIDGQDITEGKDLIVQPNDSIDIERFIKNGNLSEGNRLKFIERTGKIEDHRGIKVDDGLIRIEFQKEKVAPKVETVVVKTVHEHVHHDCWGYPYWNRPYYYGSPYYGYGSCGGFAGGVTFTNTNGIQSASLNNIGSSVCDSSAAAYTANVASSDGGGVVGNMSFNATPTMGQSSVDGSAEGMMRGLVGSSVNFSAPVQQMAQEVNDAGITVAGSLSNQNFTVVSSFPLEDQKHVIILKLLGKAADKVVKQAVVVRQKQVCQSCGTRNRGQNKCCRECGTFLEVV
jgi:hypothetical protein